MVRKSKLFNGDGGKNRKTQNFFNHMHERCKTRKSYLDKGIKVCDEWSYTAEGYQSYKTWLLAQITKQNMTLDEFNSLHHHELTIDRIDNSKGYSPSNCRLTNNYVQSRNRPNYCHSYLGVHIYDWADLYNLNYYEVNKAWHNNTIADLLNEFITD